MPKALHDKIERQAEKMGMSGERKDAYVYGTMRKVEEMHGNKKKGKKKSMMGGGYGK